MIDYLLSLGIDEDEIRNIFSMNPNIDDIDAAKKNIELLKFINCNDGHIANILVSNPVYLNNNPVIVMELIKYLTAELKLTTLNLLFDSNPWLLNKTANDIKVFVQLKLSNGTLFEEIRELIDRNPFAIDEE